MKNTEFGKCKECVNCVPSIFGKYRCEKVDLPTYQEHYCNFCTKRTQVLKERVEE